jgi:transposase InsO family protein
MRYEFIDHHRSALRVTKMCQVLEVSRSAYYAYRRRPKSPRERNNEWLVEKIKEIYRRSRRSYGSPRITAELHDQGICCGHNRVARLMRQNDIMAKRKRRFKVTTHSRHKLPVAPNLVDRQFLVDAPDQLWVSDITYIHTLQGWLYLAAILDVYSRQIVGWSMDAFLGQELVLRALRQALGRRQPAQGLIFHSDRGVQYASQSVRTLLADWTLRQSMSGKGNCYDNAIMESFFATLKTELIYEQTYQSRAEARQSVFEYIEVFYNRFRKHSALRYLSPAQFEKQLKEASPRVHIFR